MRSFELDLHKLVYNFIEDLCLKHTMKNKKGSRIDVDVDVAGPI